MALVKRDIQKDAVKHIQSCFAKLKNCQTISKKMELLCDLSCLTDHDLSSRNFIRKKILTVLKPYYPHCQVFIFGSSGNGFGTRGCDLDLLFLPYPEYCQLGNEEEEDKAPSLFQVRNGDISQAELAQLGERAQLRFVIKVLRYHRFFFKHIMFIPAKCPILNFRSGDKFFQISCDLSSRNCLVVYNTELLRFFGMIDERVKPLVVTLRCWGKAFGFIEKAALSSYAYTLLVIFFLQNTNPPILPSVDFLMALSNSSCLVAGWEVAFMQDLEKLPKCNNSSSLEDLLREFYSYFWNFDFTRNVVCIRTGNALPITELKNCTEERIKSFEVSLMCIQDPFKLSHNVGKNLKHEGLHHFKASLFIAHKILSSREDCKISEDRLMSLFNKSHFETEIKEIFYSLDPEHSSMFCINLDYKINSSLGDGENFYKKWFTKASEAVLDLLEHGLLMECEVIDKASFVLNRNSIASDVQQSCENQNCLLTIQCAVYDRVWTGRKTKLELPPFDSDADANELSNIVLKTEYIISKCIITANPHFSCPEPILWFLCRCYKTGFIQIPCVTVILTPITRTKEFKPLSKFLSSFIPVNVTKFLVDTDHTI